jgi:hypothetical protein
MFIVVEKSAVDVTLIQLTSVVTVAVVVAVPCNPAA